MPKLSHSFCGLTYEILKGVSSSSNTLDRLSLQIHTIFFPILIAECSFCISIPTQVISPYCSIRMGRWDAYVFTMLTNLLNGIGREEKCILVAHVVKNLSATVGKRSFITIY